MKYLRHCGIGLMMFIGLIGAEAWALSVSPSSLSFTAVQGGPNPASQALHLSKNNNRRVSWAGSDNASWLTLTPTSGQLEGLEQIQVNVNTAGLAPGLYTATVIVRASKGGTVSIPVTLNMTAMPTASTPPPSSGLGTATLTWSANSETDLAGYKVYVGNAPGAYGAPIVLGKQTSYVVPNLQSGNTYYFAVSAYDTSGNESTLSSIASKSIY